MTKLFRFCVVVSLTLITSTATANTTASSTLWFHEDTSHILMPNWSQGFTTYTGTVPMTAGHYYVPGGPGASIWDQGGFDVYAKEGGTAYVAGSTLTIGPDHDAYSAQPDHADWDKYSLELTETEWYLRYTDTVEAPMSGTLVWTGYDSGYTYGYAHETDGNCTWGGDVIPLQYSTFAVYIGPMSTGNGVSLTPVSAPAPGAMLLGGIGVGLVGWLRRRRAL